MTSNWNSVLLYKDHKLQNIYKKGFIEVNGGRGGQNLADDSGFNRVNNH